MIHWNEVDTVLLDMDGTLLDLHFDNFFWLEHLPERYAVHHGMDKSQALETLTLQMEQKQGQLEWYCLDYWSELTHMPIAQLKQDISHKIKFRPHVPDFLEALRKAGKRSVIVTNAHRDSVDLKMLHTGLDNMVDRIISSHDYGYAKEDQRFWQHLMEDEGFDKQRTVLIDDSLAVLESAQRYGIQHLMCIHEPDSQKPKREITQFRSIDAFKDVMPANKEAPSE
ncbi:GMP/IMP nucleotidase [Oceaniserpentilla sp. 4NH20-0058]|uniref:GMP/IMP nucleotidase n=1 Tax=Oceaniserpentilla sp. 4NH20-0058 TaxID=3127660 RepID=UPI0031081A4C